MNGYFMFKQRLTCHLMPPEKIHPDLFKGANRKFRSDLRGPHPMDIARGPVDVMVIQPDVSNQFRGAHR
jgi:hypothetical protein